MQLFNLAPTPKDGVLVVEAPVKSPNYQSIRMSPEQGLAIQPSANTEERQLAVKRMLALF